MSLFRSLQSKGAISCITIFTKQGSALSENMLESLRGNRVGKNGVFRYTIDESEAKPTEDQLKYMKTFIQEFQTPCCIDWDHRKSAVTMDEVSKLLHRFH